MKNGERYKEGLIQPEQVRTLLLQPILVPGEFISFAIVSNEKPLLVLGRILRNYLQLKKQLAKYGRLSTTRDGKLVHSFLRMPLDTVGSEEKTASCLDIGFIK